MPSNQDEVDKVLIAQPNLANLTAEVQVEVANSPAFQCLEENFYHGNITGTEVALLKMKYAQLYKALTKTRDNEYHLLQMSKRFVAVLEVQQADLTRSDQFPENISTNVSRLRCDHLRTENSLMATEERVEKLVYKMELLTSEKKLLQREYSRMPKHELDNLGDEDIVEAMHRITKTLTIENQELGIDIDKLRREKHKISENLRISMEQETEMKETKNQMQSLMDKTKSDLFTTSQLPGQYSKEYEKLRRYKLDSEKELAHANETVSELQALFNVLVHAKSEVDVEILNAKATYNLSKKEKQEINHQTDDMIKQYCLQRDLEMQNRTEKASLELASQSLHAYKKEYLETLSRGNKEKEKMLRVTKMNVLQLNIANESLYQSKQIYDKVRSKYVNFPKDDATYYDKRIKLSDDVSGLKVTLEEEGTKTSIIVTKVLQSVSEAERRLMNLDNNRAECVELVKLASRIAEKRERAAIEFFNSDRRYRRVKEELEVKGQTLLDQSKELEILNTRAVAVARLYSDIKMERNKCVALLQLTSQAHLGNKERMRLRLNEQSIIHTYVIQEERSIVSLKKQISAAIVDRDNMRNDICRVSSIRIEQNYKREVMRLNIQRLNNMFNKIEADIIQTKKLTEKNVVFRNERAMQLIERNEDVYILDERTRLQNSRCRNAQIELQSLIERISCLLRYKAELEDFSELLKKKVPLHNQLKESVQQLNVKYAEVKDNSDKLISRVEDPDAPGRLRLLEGRDLEPDTLQKKVDVVEHRLINKEEQLLEKDLLYEAVSRLVDQVQLRSVIGKNDTIKVAKSVNEIKSRIMNVDKQLKIQTAELTIKMTQTYNLQKEEESHNGDLNQRYDRLEHNITPSLDIKRDMTRKRTHKAIKAEYRRTKNIKKKIYPKPMQSRLFFNPHAPENRLPPIRDRVNLNRGCGNRFGSAD